MAAASQYYIVKDSLEDSFERYIGKGKCTLVGIDDDSIYKFKTKTDAERCISTTLKSMGIYDIRYLFPVDYKEEQNNIRKEIKAAMGADRGTWMRSAFGTVDAMVSKAVADMGSVTIAGKVVPRSKNIVDKVNMEVAEAKRISKEERAAERISEKGSEAAVNSTKAAVKAIAEGAQTAVQTGDASKNVVKEAVRVEQENNPTPVTAQNYPFGNSPTVEDSLSAGANSSIENSSSAEKFTFPHASDIASSKKGTTQAGKKRGRPKKSEEFKMPERNSSVCENSTVAGLDAFRSKVQEKRHEPVGEQSSSRVDSSEKGTVIAQADLDTMLMSAQSNISSVVDGLTQDENGQYTYAMGVADTVEEFENGIPVDDVQGSATESSSVEGGIPKEELSEKGKEAKEPEEKEPEEKELDESLLSKLTSEDIRDLLDFTEEGSDATNDISEEQIAKESIGAAEAAKKTYTSINELTDIGAMNLAKVCAREKYSETDGRAMWIDRLSGLCGVVRDMNLRMPELVALQSQCDKRITDLLHYIEFSDFGTLDGKKAYAALRIALQERRELKEEVKFILQVRSIPGLKGVASSIAGAIANSTGEKSYKPRVESELFLDNGKKK